MQKTTYATFLFLVQLWLLEIIYPMSTPFTDEPLLELAFAVMLPAIVSIESINLCKYFTIITTHPDEISAFIVNKLHRGAFSHQPKTVVTTVVNRPQGVLLQRHIKEVDPNAFILIANTSEIIGKGFRGVS